MGGVPHGWGPALGGGQGWGLTHDVRGREWIPGGQPTLGWGSAGGGRGGWRVARTHHGAPA